MRAVSTCKSWFDKRKLEEKEEEEIITRLYRVSINVIVFIARYLKKLWKNKLNEIELAGSCVSITRQMHGKNDMYIYLSDPPTGYNNIP